MTAHYNLLLPRGFHGFFLGEITARFYDPGQVAYVPDSQLQGVYLGQLPLRGDSRGDTLPEALKRLVNRLHPPSLPHVGCLPLVYLLRGEWFMPINCIFKVFEEYIFLVRIVGARRIKPRTIIHCIVKVQKIVL